MGEGLDVVLLNFFMEGLSLQESVDFLDSCCDSLLCVFEAQRRLPLGTGLDFYSSVFLVLLLKFRYQDHWIPLHILLAKLNLRNEINLFIRVLTFLRDDF